MRGRGVIGVKYDPPPRADHPNTPRRQTPEESREGTRMGWEDVISIKPKFGLGLGSGFHYFIPIAPTFTLDGKQ